MERPRRGQRLKARTLRDIIDENRANRIVSTAGILVARSPLGTSVTVSPTTDSFWILLTAAGVGINAGRYAWRYAKRIAGTWVLGSAGGTITTNWAQEANGFGGLGAVYVEVRRYGGQVIFQLETCP